jgi:hypothetical protein
MSAHVLILSKEKTMAQDKVAMKLGFDGKPAFEQFMKPDGVDADGAPKFKPVDYVNFESTWDQFPVQQTRRIAHMMPNAGEGQDEHSMGGRKIRTVWDFIKGPYEDWKGGIERELTGTPLDVMDGLNAQQIRLLHEQSIRTLEELRDCSDAQLNRVALPDKHRLRMRAKDKLAYMAKSETKDELAAVKELASIQATQMDEMRAMLAESMKQLADLKSALGEGDDTAKRCGRQPRADQAEAA